MDSLFMLNRPAYRTSYSGMPAKGAAGTNPAPPAGSPAVTSKLGTAGVYQDPAAQKHYRSDFGSEMTDAEYRTALQQKEADDYQRDSSRRQTEAQAAQQMQLQSQTAMQALQNNRPQDTAPSFVTGGNAVSGQANEQQQMLMLQSQLAQQQMAAEQAFARESAGAKMQAIERLSGNGSPTAAQVQHPSAGMAGGNEAAARAAAFARAKDLAGQNALAALKSVNSFTEGRGLMGSTVEGNLMGSVLGGAQGDINDFISEQLISDLNRAAEVNDMQYQGGIQQRGQDLNRQQALLGLLAAGGLY